MLERERRAHHDDEASAPAAAAASSSSVVAYGGSAEPRSVGELAELLLDPDAVRANSLLVRERVLGPLHPDTAYYVRYRGAVYADAGDFARCITLWTHAVDMQTTHLEPLAVATQVIAKFHDTDTGPTRTRTFLRRNSVGSARVRFAAKKVRFRVRVRVGPVSVSV